MICMFNVAVGLVYFSEYDLALSIYSKTLIHYILYTIYPFISTPVRYHLLINSDDVCRLIYMTFLERGKIDIPACYK